MKQVITSVGTSIFKNFLDRNRGTLNQNLYRYIENKPYSRRDDHNNEISNLKSKVLDWCEMEGIKSSAEIQSTVELVKNIKDDVTIHLIATDTIDSYLAAEIIKSYFNNKNNVDGKQISVKFNTDQYIIKGLQVDNRETFSKVGLANLIHQIMKMVEGFNASNVTFNITGGYKGVIPFLTIMATVNKCDLYYMNERSSELMKISPLPISIDYEMFGKHYEIFLRLEDGIENYKGEIGNHYNIYKELEQKGMIDVEDNIAMLSNAGLIFFKKYKEPLFTFYCDDSTWEKIEHHDGGLVKRDLETQLWKDDIRHRNTDITTNTKHKKYGIRRKKVRILYFEHGQNIYIYDVFNNAHDDYEDEIGYNFTNELKQEIISRAKPRQIEKITH